MFYRALPVIWDGPIVLSNSLDERQFPAWLNRCRHFVAAHEQRLQCFPLIQSVVQTGNYPLNAEAIIYPGCTLMSVVAYPVRDQGKSRGDSGDILSQIALQWYVSWLHLIQEHHLLVYSKFVTPLIKGVSPLRIMSPSSVKEFMIANSLTKRLQHSGWQTLLNTTCMARRKWLDTRSRSSPINLSAFL